MGGLLHAELMPVPGTSIKSLDFARLSNYLQVILNDPDVPKTVRDWEIRRSVLAFLLMALTAAPYAQLQDCCCLELNPAVT